VCSSDLKEPDNVPTTSNTGTITINDHSAASPYPSEISVSGLTEPISGLTVTLHDLAHAYPADISVLLVGPTGINVVLMANTGGLAPVSNINLTFMDGAPAILQLAELATGTYGPSAFGVPTFPAPAPGTPYGNMLSAFNGTDGNGAWKLYVIDGTPSDSGQIAGGWSLNFEQGLAPAYDSITAGLNGTVETVAAGDDVQQFNTATQGLSDISVIISAGDNGILDTTVLNGDDKFAITKGYATSFTCNELTTERIVEPNDEFADGIVSTVAAGDDVQVIALGDGAGLGAVIISPGPNGIIDSVPAGDDTLRGPGEICDFHTDCPVGACTGRKVLRRFGSSKIGRAHV